MAKILWNEGVTLQNMPQVKEVHDIYRAFLLQGFKQLVNDCVEVAAFEGGTLSDTFMPVGVMLADFANLLQLDQVQMSDIFGPYADCLVEDGLILTTGGCAEGARGGSVGMQNYLFSPSYPERPALE